MNRRDLLKLGVALPVSGLAQWTPSFFNAHQNQTVIDFSDRLIPTTDTPGAKDAQVNRYLDKLLEASDASFQTEFSHDLETLDNFSRQTAGAEFIRLSPVEQDSVMEKMFLSDQRPSFDRLKAWTARIYYATKEGFDDLNKGGRVPASFACSISVP